MTRRPCGGGRVGERGRCPERCLLFVTSNSPGHKECHFLSTVRRFGWGAPITPFLDALAGKEMVDI